MSKAEDLAKELFPLLETDKIGNNPYISYNTEQLAKQEGFVGGYHQAEKDNELTVEDIVYIIETYNKLEFSREFATVTFNDTCKEILKRFKDYKERKEK